MLWILLALAAAPQTTVIVRLRPQAELPRDAGLRRTLERLHTVAAAPHESLDALLVRGKREGAITRVTPLWIINALSVTGTEEALAALAADPLVASLSPDAVPIAPVTEPNLIALDAPPVWDAGVRGQGVVVANLDTGVDVTHPSLAAQFRGGAHSWFDAFAQHPTPVDLNGHGTWTMGVMVGADVGVAPGAQWIAAKVFNDQGATTATAIHRAFQWLLDPDGDPTTDDAPDVVNNSWAWSVPGCFREFEADLRALRAAGIVVVFAAGNLGPSTATSTSPANYPDTFSVGAPDTGSSSRGPSACDGNVYPDVVAPGQGINTTDLSGGYASVSGTSLSAPHVSGTFALLKSAFPAASVDDLEAAVQLSAVDLGLPGPDDEFGAGQVDARAAWERLGAPALTAQDDAWYLDEDAPLHVGGRGVLRNDRGAAQTALLFARPAHGTLVLRPSGAFAYTPAPDFNGVDRFRYVASDGVHVSAPATVTLGISPMDDPPVARDDQLAITGTTKLDLLGNDFDRDSVLAPASVTIVTCAAKGSLTVLRSGLVVYRPRKGARGVDSFTYRVADVAGVWSNVATVRVVQR